VNGSGSSTRAAAASARVEATAAATERVLDDTRRRIEHPLPHLPAVRLSGARHAPRALHRCCCLVPVTLVDNASQVVKYNVQPAPAEATLQSTNGVLGCDGRGFVSFGVSSRRRRGS
jgi:hypothetical protein